MVFGFLGGVSTVNNNERMLTVDGRLAYNLQVQQEWERESLGKKTEEVTLLENVVRGWCGN